jgi:hypothetical protein
MITPMFRVAGLARIDRQTSNPLSRGIMMSSRTTSEPERLLAVGGHPRLVRGLGQEGLEQFGPLGVVFRDQDAGGRAHVVISSAGIGDIVGSGLPFSFSAAVVSAPVESLGLERPRT